MRAVNRWLRDRRIRTKLAILAVVALGGMAAGATVGLDALDESAALAADLQGGTALTRAALEADMAHDAIRGDVLRALLAPSLINYQVRERGLTLDRIKEGLDRFLCVIA